jgi:phosphomannomutase
LWYFTDPAIAEITRHTQSDIGIVISASHAPACGNVIQFSNADGEEWTISKEELEQTLKNVTNMIIQSQK